MRKKGTPAEVVLWQQLRRKQFEGCKFRRQQPIGQYIVDFVSFENDLVIEIDGGQHNQREDSKRDENRTAWLNGRGFHVIRFWNSDVLGNLNGVLLAIQAWLDCPSPPLTLSFTSSPVQGEER